MLAIRDTSAARMRSATHTGKCSIEDEVDDLLLWFAYARTRDAITAARPQTLAGRRANARAAKGEADAMFVDGTEFVWAWQPLTDVLADRDGEAA